MMPPATTGAGRCVIPVTTAPAPTKATNSATATRLTGILPRSMVMASSPRLVRIALEFLQLLDKLFQRESGRAGARHNIAGDLVEQPLPLRVVALHLLCADECPRALLRFQHPANFQLAISAHHRVRINREIDRELPHGGKLVAGGQRAGSDAAHHQVDDLAVRRHAAVQVEPEREAPRSV